MKSLTLLLVALVLGGCATGRGMPDSAQARAGENCKASSEQEIAALFERWNQALQTGDASAVLANYAERSILLPTLSKQTRFTADEKADYFRHFMENGPSGVIELRFIELGCNTAVDAGLYTFSFAKTGTVSKARYSFTYHWDGTQWLITSHHSSLMPETDK
jgi:uncharacterized protein (TIGR02246 family)